MNSNWEQIISTGSIYWMLVIIATLLFIVAFRGEKHEKGSKK